MDSLEGVLCIDKPGGFTSFDVIAKLRGITRQKRLGHAGTLDPMATGVLPVFFGRATKAIDLLPNHDKAYEAVFELGIVTDTYDITGKILEKRRYDVTASRMEAALADFIGEQEQLPPMYSAVKVNGRRLYDIARSGGEAERKPRRVTIHSLEMLGFDEGAGICSIRVSCSGGTYIRALCHDLGQKLGCGAAMTALRRTSACGFTLADCFTLDEAQSLADSGGLVSRILPVASVFSHLPVLTLSREKAGRYCNGLELRLSQFGRDFGEPERLAVYREDGRFLGISEADPGSDRLRLVKLFTLGDNR